MYYILLLGLAIFPVVVILFFINSKDRNKEPLSLLIKLFLAGFLSCILVLIISAAMGIFLPFMRGTLASKGFIDMILYAFVGVALVEEFCKWSMTYLVGYNNREFDELYDGLVYSVFVSLGFAFVENILYVITSASVQTAFLRAVSAVPSHACDAIFMGYYLSIAKQLAIRGNKKKEKLYLVKSIFIPAIIHGIYDYCLMSGITLLVVVFFIFVILMYIFSLRKLGKLANHNKKIIFKNKFCKTCGKAVTGEYCSRCGTRQE